MKVAYISVYRDGTGYGDSALEYIKALDHVGVDVVPIWVTLSGQPYVDPGEKIKSLERKVLMTLMLLFSILPPTCFAEKKVSRILECSTGKLLRSEVLGGLAHAI